MLRLPRHRGLRFLSVAALVAALGLAGIAAAIAFLPWSPVVASRVARILSDRLGVNASLATLSVSLLPHLRITGSGLEVRLKNEAKTTQPFVAVDRFWVDVGVESIFRAHVGTVHLTGLRIAVPPHARRTLARPPSEGHSPILIDRLEAPDADLRILRGNPSQPPVVFPIQSLVIEHLAYDRRMTFSATLTNPMPRGEVVSTGSIGPWQKDDPTALPVSGDYTFSNADLSTIRGIAGRLESQGHYDGDLTDIQINGTCETPQFSLDLGGKPQPFSATFDAEVNATDGTTVLNAVDAHLLSTAMHVSGAITNLPGPGNHDVRLQVSITDGRLEDLLRLAIDTPEPPLVGHIAMHAAFALPPGPTPVDQRLTISGQFTLLQTQFTDPATQQKMRDLSRRSQGLDKEDPLGRVLTNLKGSFSLAHGVLALPHFTFQVPGAAVALSGTYRVKSEALDFVGTLRMKASVSDAVGGFKSIFLKPFNFIFRKDGAGAVVPIKIGGTRHHPKMGIRFGKVFFGD